MVLSDQAVNDLWNPGGKYLYRCSVRKLLGMHPLGRCSHLAKDQQVHKLDPNPSQSRIVPSEYTGGKGIHKRARFRKAILYSFK